MQREGVPWFKDKHVPVSDISVKPPLQVCQYIALLQWDETSIFSVEIIEKFWGNMETLSSQRAVEKQKFEPKENKRFTTDVLFQSF